MSSRTRHLVSVAALLASLVAGMHTASAAVMPISGANIDVSANVVAACQVDTGARATVSCDSAGTQADIRDTDAADLPNPTSDEQAAPAATGAVVVTY